MEKVMQHIWGHRLWTPARLVTVDGREIEVLDPGIQNKDAGPDFFNAKVRIDGKTWAGNVEIHVKASDWKRHGHDGDTAYGNVILHVVGKDDMRIRRRDGVEIPQVVMACAEQYKDELDHLTDRPDYELACFRQMQSVPQIYRTDWLTALAFERMQEKANRFIDIMRRTGQKWNETLYIVLARALGFRVNSEPFERLAAATPLSVLLHYQYNTQTIESILFGQAGLLDAVAEGSAEAQYLDALRRDYDFFSRKHSLHRPSELGWKLARMRPQNFPHRRIAWLASLISRGFLIANEISTIDSAESARRLFENNLSSFWASHFTFAPSSGHISPHLSRTASDVLIINVVVPAMLAYSKLFGGDCTLETCTQILQSLPPENNRIVRLFGQAGVECPDAFASQALIQLRRAYCEPRKCLDCRFGHRFIAQAVRCRK